MSSLSQEPPPATHGTAPDPGIRVEPVPVRLEPVPAPVVRPVVRTNRGGTPVPTLTDNPDTTRNRERRSANLPSRPEKGLHAETPVDIGLGTEYDLYDLVGDIEQRLESGNYGKEMTVYSQILKGKMVAWRANADKYSLKRSDFEERRKIEEECEEQIKNITAKSQGWQLGRVGINVKYAQSVRGNKLRLLEKKIEKRREAVRRMTAGIESASDSEKKKADTDFAELKREFGLEGSGLTREQIIERLSGYLEEDAIIFDKASDIVLAEAYLRYAEKKVALQAGVDVTDGGRTSIPFDFSDATIDRLEQEHVDPKEIQIIKRIATFVKAGDMEGVLQYIAAGGVGLYEAFVRPIVMPSIVPGSEPGTWAVVGTQLGPGEQAIVGVVTMLAAKAIFAPVGRRVRQIVFELPDPRTEGRVNLTLHFEPTGDPLSAQTQDPLRQIYAGRPAEAKDFLIKSMTVRADVLSKLGWDSNEIEQLVNISDEEMALGPEAGWKIPYQRSFSEHLEKFLSDNHPNATGGGHKNFDDLTSVQQNEALDKVMDIVALEMGDYTLDDAIRNAALNEILGEEQKQRSGRTDALSTSATNLETGVETHIKKKDVQTLEQVDASLKTARARRDVVVAGQTRYTQLAEQIKTKETTVADKRREAEKTAREKADLTKLGKSKKAPQEKAIQTLENRRDRLSGELQRLRDEIGDGSLGGTGLLSRRLEMVKNKAMADQDLDNTQAVLKERNESLKILKSRKWQEITADPAEKDRLIKELEDKTDPPQAGSIREAEKKKADATQIQAAVQAQLDQVNADIRTKNERITQLGKEGGTLDNLDDQIEQKTEEMARVKQEAVAAITTAQQTFEKELEELNALVEDRNRLLQEAFGIDTAVPGFKPPSAETLESIKTNLITQIGKLEHDLTDMTRRINQGYSPVTSDEDLEEAKGLRLYSVVAGETEVNQLLWDIYNNVVKAEDLAKVTNNEGYNLLLRSIWGDDAFSAEKYRIVARITSKARLADAAIKIFNIKDEGDDRGFFAGDKENASRFRNARMVQQEIVRLNSVVERMQAQIPPPANLGDELTRLRTEIAANEANRNVALGELYDTRIAKMFASDRVRTAETVRMTLDTVYHDAMAGNIFAKTAVEVVSGPPEHIDHTSEGTIVLRETTSDVVTRKTKERGRIEARTLANLPGVEVDIDISTNTPPDNLNVTVILDRFNGGLDHLPQDENIDMPSELNIVYGNPDRRRNAVDYSGITADIYRSLPATLADAQREGITNEAILYWIYAKNGNIRTADELRTGGLKLKDLPEDRNDPALDGISTELLDFLYFYRGDRLVRGINLATIGQALVDSIPYISRLDAENAAMNMNLIDLFYGPNQTDGKRPLADIRAAGVPVLPQDGDEVRGQMGSNAVFDFFYEWRGETKRTNADITETIRAYPEDRNDPWVSANLLPGVIDLVYEPGGRKRNPESIRRITVTERNLNEAGMESLLSSFYLDSPMPAEEMVYDAVAEGFAHMDRIARMRMLGDRFREFPISINNHFRVRFEQAGDHAGDITVNYTDPTNGTVTVITLTELLENKFIPAIGAEINSNPSLVSTIKREVSRECLISMKSIPVV